MAPVKVPLKPLPLLSTATVPRGLLEAPVAAPGPGNTEQALPVQATPGWHWAAAVQVLLQAPAPQTYRPQLRVPPGAQVPRPLQVLAAVSVDPVQLVAEHRVPVGCSRQAPLPLQPPRRPQVPAACIGHRLRGS